MRANGTAIQPESEAFERWAKRAVRKVWFPKEREQVRKELEDHYQDRVAEYRSRGLPETEAMRRAVEILGDPEETAELLGRVHQPLLTLLLRVFRILVLLVAFAMLIALVMEQFTTRGLRRFDAEALAQTSRYGSGNEYRQVMLSREAVSTDMVNFGPFRVSCAGGSIHLDRTVCVDDYGRPMISKDRDQTVMLSYTAAPWHRMRSDVVDRVIRIVDDEGNEYYNVTDFSNWKNMEGRSFFQYTGRIDPFTCATVFYLDDSCRNASWLDIYLTQGEQSARLRVSFTRPRFWRENLDPMTDEAAAVRSMAQEPPTYENILQYYALTDFRMGSQTAPRENAFRVPWLRLGSYRLDPVRLTQGEMAGDYLDRELPEEIRLAECVAVFPDYPDDFPLYLDDLYQRLELRVPESGERCFYQFTRYPAYYTEACLVRLEWEPVEGAERYELSYTDPDTGERSTVILTLGEEAAS